MKSQSNSHRMSRLGAWLPGDRRHLGHWLRTTRTAIRRHGEKFHPIVEEFQELIEGDPVLRMYFTRMFQEQPRRRLQAVWGDARVKSYIEMLEVLNHVLTRAPEYNRTYMVGCPINAILDCPMITPTGLAAFADGRVNAMLRRYFAVWTEFLSSEKSRYVLNDSPRGWLSAQARAHLHLDEFETDPNAPYLGFRSWNDFFIRKFKPGQRPIASPGDSGVVINACESAPFAIERRVRASAAFWIKEQPYSLRDLLAGHFVEQFVGGTVYQAFLSARNYHRWHSPVSGTIRKLEHIPGTYYAEASSEHFDPAGPNNSQSYLAHVATRALIFIDADDPRIGLMCLVAIGMAEVSSCVLEGASGRVLREGQHLIKGGQLGYFQFGGSTHCLVFGPQVRLRFVPDAHPRGPHASKSVTLKVNSHLATVLQRSARNRPAALPGGARISRRP
jgi:phosphatidylserine decarboxylase